eukprot:9478369-Pyramimonas_sp.AAC.1
MSWGRRGEEEEEWSRISAIHDEFQSMLSHLRYMKQPTLDLCNSPQRGSLLATPLWDPTD